MDDIAPLLAIVLYWRLLLVLAGCLAFALLVATAFPGFTHEAVLVAFCLGVGIGVAWETQALRRRFPEGPSPPESPSSRVVALLGFSVMGALVGGLGSFSSVHSVLFALAFMAAIPLTLGPLLSLRSASRPRFKLLVLSAAAMWAGFGLVQGARMFGVAV